MFCMVVAQRGRKSPGAREEEVEVRSHDTDYTTAESQSAEFTHDSNSFLSSLSVIEDSLVSKMRTGFYFTVNKTALCTFHSSFFSLFFPFFFSPQLIIKQIKVKPPSSYFNDLKIFLGKTMALHVSILLNGSNYVHIFYFSFFTK